MSRKRSVASLLDDLDEESSTNQPSARSSTRKKVSCNCSDCNGSLVDPRTREIYECRQDTILEEI